MKSGSKRPIAIWIALGILPIYILLLALGLFFPTDRSVLDTPDVADVVADFVEVGAVIITLFIAFLALAMRKKWGRWFVLAPLVFIIGVLIWGEFFSGQVVESSEERIYLLLGACVGLAPLLIVFLLVSFGSAVKNYFAASAKS